MPGYKVYLQDGGEIREELTCCHCKLVLNDPVQTRESGLRLCRGCYETNTKEDSGELDSKDQVWPDSAVKREIANLKVKCENYMVGCDWEGLFKQLLQHSQQCQYVTVECRNPGCGQQVLLSKIEIHLKEECPRRHVKCKNCDETMFYNELQDHVGECPNAPITCKNCGKKMYTYKLADHMIHECKHVRCVCSNDGSVYEAGSTQFHSHLQDVSKLADHLGPMICEFTKMSEAFKEMSTAYQQATKRIDVLEKCRQEDIEQIKMLEKSFQECAQRVETLENCHRVENEMMQRSESLVAQLESKSQELENQIRFLTQSYDSLAHSCNSFYKSVNGMAHTVQRVKSDVKKCEDNLLNMEKKSRRDHYDILLRLQDMNTVAIISSGDKVVPHENASAVVKQIEDKVLEVESILNVLNARHSELELQVEVSFASTYNGAFLWHIPDVRQKTRDARMGGNISIDSLPFYTGRNGYKMCIRAYLNGDGIAEGTHLSIFFIIMKGECDPLLQWPFKHKVSLILLNQEDSEKHLVLTFKPDLQSCSFQKPETDMNVASGCPHFADLSILEDLSYTKNDEMYIKAIVDTSTICHP